MMQIFDFEENPEIIVLKDFRLYVTTYCKQVFKGKF